MAWVMVLAQWPQVMSSTRKTCIGLLLEMHMGRMARYTMHGQPLCGFSLDLAQDAARGKVPTKLRAQSAVS
jgi:hypothetical protein